MLIVQKFGGTSVGSVERIKNVARRIAAWHKKGHDIAVVVSAMAGETNRLLDLVSQLDQNPSARERDVVSASGEQVSMALLAIALQQIGTPSVSLAGWQAGIKTNQAHGKARITEIDTERVTHCLKNRTVVIVAGFQGITPDGDISTLGRGGSDTSAVALAAALKADECQIYTDVDGIYTTDPRIEPKARRIETITFEEILEMAGAGSKVLQIRSVEMAYKQMMPLRVLSSLSTVSELTDIDITHPGGSLICLQYNDEETTMERPKITGVSSNRDEAKISVRGVPDVPGIAYTLLRDIAKANIEVDMIVQNFSANNLTDFTFTVHRNNYTEAMKLSKKSAASIGASEVIGDDKVVKVSLVGVGMRSHAGIAAEMFEALAKANINILIISTSEIKISVGLEEKYLEKAVRVLHAHFQLASPSVQ